MTRESTKMTKRRKAHEGDSQRPHQHDEDFIPLPIQTFLWRQTNPFVRPGKARELAQIEQRDACKLFERIIITNNIWGQSPSLTDAIASIDRWRLIKVSFPFVLQCTAALLNNKLIKDNNFNRLGGNEAKMMYTLQWILMNASEECADSENEAKNTATNVAIAAATAASLFKPTDNVVPQAAPSASGSRPTAVSQASSSSTSTGVEPSQVSVAGGHPMAPSSNRVGSTSSAHQSILLPTAMAAVAVATPTGMSTLQMQATLPSSSSVSPIGSSTPTKPMTPSSAASCPSNYLLPISSIQMFTYYFAPIMDGLKHSDFLSSNQRLEIGAALWEPLFNHQLPDIHCLKARVKPLKSSQASAQIISSDFFPPNQISTKTFKSLISTQLSSVASKQIIGTATANKLQLNSTTSNSMPTDRRRSSTLDQSNFGDVFLGGPTPPASGTVSSPVDGNVIASEAQNRMQTAQNISNSSHATYMDVAVLRCLFISDWQESGVFWAISFLSNRIANVQYRDDDHKAHTMRPRSRSLSCLDYRQFKSVQVLGHAKDHEIKLTTQMDSQTNKTINKKQTSMEKSTDHSSAGRFLRVEDAETSDSGGDGKEPKSPIRRLSFSSGMQTLANQIRRTSKRVKKSSEGQTNDGIMTESQLSINQQADGRPSSPSLRHRRSSSADDLTSGQLATLSTLQTELKPSVSTKLIDKHSTESNPVITVTTNIKAKAKASMQKKDAASKTHHGKHLYMQTSFSKSLRHLDMLIRRQSIPKNMRFSPYGTTKDSTNQNESMGATHYVDDLGRIDPIVVLKVLHSISQRESACSQRVCDKILNLVSKLISIGILKTSNKFADRASQKKDLISLLPTRQHDFTLINGKTQVLQTGSKQRLSEQKQFEEALARSSLIHKITTDIVFRIYHHMGCPNNCGMSSTVDHHNRGHTTKLPSFSGKTTLSLIDSGRNLRLRLRETLEYLGNFNRDNFNTYIQDILSDRPLLQVVDMLHSLLGFCRQEHTSYAKHHSHPTVQFMPTPSASGSNLNEVAPPRTLGGSLGSTNSDLAPTFETGKTRPQGSSSGGRHASLSTSPNQAKKSSETVEYVIVSSSFKQLITRMASMSKELKFQENTALYCDIRRLISFTRDNYTNTFRGIVLSALIDCTKLLSCQQKLIATSEQSSQKRNGDFTRPPSEDESTGPYENHTSNVKKQRAFVDVGSDALDKDSNKMADSAALSCSSTAIQQSPLIQSSSSAMMMEPRTSLGSYRFYPAGHPKHMRQMSPLSNVVGQQDQQHSQTTGILSLSKAKKKLEQVFGGKQGSRSKLNSSHWNEDSAQSGSIGTAVDQDNNNGGGGEGSRRTSLVGHQSVGSFHETTRSRLPSNYAQHLHPGSSHLTNLQLAKQNQLLFATVQVGMSNFSFLMESCMPGDFLDPALLAALLDLKSPVAIRAAIYLECANFVHRCNRGQWPNWMRMNVAHHRGSNAGLKHRKSSSMQRSQNNTLMYRAAGRAFYAWAEAVGTRLEELLQNEQESSKAAEAITEDTENDELVMSDQGTLTSSQIGDIHLAHRSSTDIDFFQSTVNGDSSPFALKLAACQLLYEVTTFLREIYGFLPQAIAQHQVGSKSGEKISSIYDVSRAVTANRRWSMALSSLGFSQLPATLNALSASAAANQSSGPSASSSGGHLKNPTTSAISEHPERRISFILHETNDEDEQLEHKQESASNQGEPTGSSNAGNNGDQQQADSVRKMTAGRHLSQSSASSAVVVAAATCLLRSSGVLEGSTHRRKSIKLKKAALDKEKSDKKAKFAPDFDEENENSSISDAGIRRTDSLRSRRRVSGISEKSDTSDIRVNNGVQQQFTQDTQQAGELSGNESAGNGSCEETYGGEVVEKFEDESKIMSNMPWFKAIAMVNSSIDCNCTHYPACRQYCYKLHQSMCKRMLSHVQSIYQDPGAHQGMSNMLESRLNDFMMSASGQSKDTTKNSRHHILRAGSDCSASALGGSIVDGETKPKDKRARKHHQQQQMDLPQDDNLSHASPKVKKQNDKSSNNGRMHSMMSYHIDSIASGNGVVISPMMADTVKALTAAKAKERVAEESPIIKYMKSNVKSLLHCPMSSFLKGAIILPRENFVEMIGFSWNLLLEDDQQLSRTAAVCFIISSIKSPTEAAKLLLEELESTDASRKMAAINKFYVIWDARYQCWPRLEDGAYVHFKMAPPSIEFTLPSPKIAKESKPVVDPPWMPRKTSNVEEVTIGQDQSVQKSFVTATKTRRKQQIEIVTKALREKHDKMREDREKYHITSVPITLYAAYEPTLGKDQTGADELDGGGGGGGGTTDDDPQQESRALSQMKTAQALFPTCLCQAAIVMINLLDDSRVTYEGSAVYEIASKVIWSCLVDDPALFLRYFFERLTRQNQSTIFQVLRRLIRFMPRLPSQAAYTLYNYLIGFIIYYIRCPVESSQKLIADTLSVLCLVVPSVYGLFLKDLKQTLRKEQCDHNLLITANVPSAKKIIVHGSDSSGIPSQFPIDESTQFYHILVDSLEFFGIDKRKQNEYFLIDVRTNIMHNLHSYVRDHYSFKRSQHPQLQLINMDPVKAFDILQKQELINQFMEFGKVSMSLSIVKSSHMAVQRVLFLHEELMKLPTFPRKALETNLGLFRGPLGHQVFSMDRIHKICWVRVIARMFELTSGFFLQLGDIQLFLNAISGIFVLHCEEAPVSRLCLATFINATHQFKSIFATEGFMPIMATIVQVYSNHQNNQLLCRSIEFVCKQFYIMHRKPFLLQLFGSVASRLNTAEVLQQNQGCYPVGINQPSATNASNNYLLNDPSRISPKAFFRLLQSLEKAFKDPLDILELVDAEKPLRAIDFCYQQDKEAIEILDIISLCVTVTAYASESPRSTQMLIILESVVPLYMKHLQASTSKKAGQSMGKQAHKDELQKIQSISICIRTLIVNCEGLTRNFNGPLPSIDFRSSSIRRTGPGGAKSAQQKIQQTNSAGSPMDIYNDEPSCTGPERSSKREVSSHGASKQVGIVSKSAKNYNSDESEITRGEFVVPRDTLLNLVAEFLSLSTGRLVESAKKYVDLHQKHSSYELLDVKSHLRLAEVANSLLKFASTDPSVMACRGLTRYMNEILPNTEWRQEAIRPALIMILKRLDKTFNRIAKKTWVKRSTDWEAAKQLLKGAYLTFIKHPYIVHLPHLKSLISCCQNIILSDGLQVNSQLSTSNLFHGFSTGQQSGIGQVSQSASMIPTQSSDRQGNSNLLNVSGSHPQAASSAPNTAMQTNNQQLPSLASVTAAATLAERLAANASSSSSATSQGFNSVTIRLIAMQLLQTGDSQTLESFIGNSMNTPEKLESLMLNLIYPMCIRVCSGAREAPKLRHCDIMFILNIVLNMLAPLSASSKSCSSTSNSPKAATDTSQFILSKITTTIGSTQTGATALGIVGSGAHSATSAHPIVQHQEGLKIGFLGLKILCVCFESQLASEWVRITRVIRDLSLQTGQPSGPLWDFLDFVATYRFPMFILLLPTIKCHLAKKVKSESKNDSNSHLLQCQRMIEAKIYAPAPTVCRSKSFLFVSLTAELRMLKEQLIAKRRMLIEGERQASSHVSQQAQGTVGGSASTGNQSGQLGEALQSDHFTAYHRLSAAIASFANQGGQGRMTASASGSNTTQQLGTALKGACFAAQLATSAPIGQQMVEGGASGSRSPAEPKPTEQQPAQRSIRLSTAKSREEARKVMNVLLRRTSYPHNQPLVTSELTAAATANVERKNSQPPSPSSSSMALGAKPTHTDAEQRLSNQIIMDPAMLMAAFPMPRKSTTEGSGILKQLLQTIDRQNQRQRQECQTAIEELGEQPVTSAKTIQSQQEVECKPLSGSRSQGFAGTTSHKHEPTIREQPEKK